MKFAYTFAIGTVAGVGAVYLLIPIMHITELDSLVALASASAAFFSASLSSIRSG